MDCEATCSNKEAPKADDPGFLIVKLNGYAFIAAILLFVLGTALTLGIAYFTRNRGNTGKKKLYIVQWL